VYIGSFPNETQLWSYKIKFLKKVSKQTISKLTDRSYHPGFRKLKPTKKAKKN
jgi:hypothetical protein